MNKEIVDSIENIKCKVIKTEVLNMCSKIQQFYQEKNIHETDNLLNIIPNTIELDISEKQAIQGSNETHSLFKDVTSDESLNGNKMLKEKITSIFSQNNIEIAIL